MPAFGFRQRQFRAAFLKIETKNGQNLSITLIISSIFDLGTFPQIDTRPLKQASRKEIHQQTKTKKLQSIILKRFWNNFGACTRVVV